MSFELMRNLKKSPDSDSLTSIVCICIFLMYLSEPSVEVLVMTLMAFLGSYIGIS